MTVNTFPKLLHKKIDLIYSSDEDAGFTRRKRGRGFQYLDENLEKINCKKTVKRIKQLVIPPMWEKVWICKKEKGHLQSTGRDLRNRKQYIYHPDYVAYRQQKKYDKLVDFVNVLPELRNVTSEHLRQRNWNRQKVLALAVKVLDEYNLRIGNQHYADQNGTFGLTTLRRKHLTMEEDGLSLDYKAKSNKYRSVNISDKRLMKLIKNCSELPGYEVFRYRDESGKTIPIDSSDVNSYIQSIMGADFSAKDFRTWNGTAYTFRFLPYAKAVLEENPRKKLETVLVRKIAGALGNTVSVCRNYYIHPKVLDHAVNQEVDFKNIPKVKELEDYEVLAKQILLDE